MINLIPEYLVIVNALKSKTSLQEAFFKVRTTTTMSSSTLKSLHHNVKLVLAHYYSLSYKVFYLFPALDKKSNESVFLITLLSHYEYLNENKKELKESFNLACNELRFNLTIKDFDIIYSFYKNKEDIISKIDDDLLSLSLKLEIPLFLLKIMIKQFDKDDLLKVSKSLHLKDNNLYLITDENYKNDKLTKYLTLNDINTYVGKVDTFSSVIKEKKVLKTSFLTLYTLSKISEYYGVTTLLISNLKDYLLPYSIYHFLENKTSIQISAFVKNPFFYRKAVEYNNLKKISINNASIDMIKTYIPYKSKNIVLYYGSSFISLNRNDPSLLLKFNESDILKEFKHNLSGLKEVSSFVSSSCYLVYLNYSFLKEVNEEVKNSFLLEKKDFTLIEEGNTNFVSSLLPAGYFAIFKRN